MGAALVHVFHRMLAFRLPIRSSTCRTLCRSIAILVSGSRCSRSSAAAHHARLLISGCYGNRHAAMHYNRMLRCRCSPPIHYAAVRGSIHCRRDLSVGIASGSPPLRSETRLRALNASAPARHGVAIKPACLYGHAAAHFSPTASAWGTPADQQFMMGHYRGRSAFLPSRCSRGVRCARVVSIHKLRDPCTSLTKS